VFQHNLYVELRHLLSAREKLLLHQEEVGDRVCGLVAGYLLWAGLVPYGPQAISVTERLTGRQLGPLGRELVATADALRDEDSDAVPEGAEAAEPGDGGGEGGADPGDRGE
ncbi:MAG TPA: hypothetical protein VGJ43_02200, partial [Acidimicrobiales bacterium]